MNNEKRDGLEIDLQKLLLAYLSKWWIIVAATALAGLMALYITANFITPTYQASVLVYVNNARSDQQVDYISSSNLATAQRLVNTYVNIIKSDSVLEKVAEESGLSASAAQLRKVMSASQVDDTELFRVTITHEDPAMAAKIANAVAEVAPAEIGNIVEGSSTKIIDYAKVPVNPASPNLNRNAVLGALVGCMLALLYLTIRFLLAVRIKDEEDLTMLFDLPVLAQIPAFAASNSKRSGYSTEKNGYGYHSVTEKGGKK